MFEYAVAALTFGFAAGLKPGPLGIVVIQQTLAHGFASGARASLAPLVTDGPIILAALLLLPRLQDIAPFVAGVSLLGGLYLLWIGGKLVRIRTITLEGQATPARSLRAAIKVNLLNPSPYLFWFSVGGAYILLGTTAQALAFAAVAVGTLVVSKMCVAGIAAVAKPLLHGAAYLYGMKALACGLMVFGGLLLVRSVEIVNGVWF